MSSNKLDRRRLPIRLTDDDYLEVKKGLLYSGYFDSFQDLGEKVTRAFTQGRLHIDGVSDEEIYGKRLEQFDNLKESSASE